MNNKTDHILSLLWISSLLILLGLSFQKINQLDIRTGEQWENHYTIVTSDASALETFLVKENLNDFLSLNRSLITYSDIAAMKTVPLKDISDYLHLLDPRFDPYMKKAAELFSAESGNEEYSLIYLRKESLSLLRLYTLLFLEFFQSDLHWQISGYNAFNFISAPFVYGIFLLMSGLLAKGKKVLSVISLAPWTPFVYLYGFPALAAAVAVSSLFHRRKSIVYTVLLLILLSLYALYSSLFSVVFCLTFITGFIGVSRFLFSDSGISAAAVSDSLLNRTASYSSGKWKRAKIKFRKPDHDLFSPVRIMVPSKKKKIPVKTACSQYSLDVLFLVLAVFLSPLSVKEDPILLPMMEEQSDLQWTMGDLAQTDNGLLSPADYIRHVAYQEGFLYGATWSYPAQEKPLVYPVFQRAQKGFSKSYEIQADYSGKWLIERVSVLKNDNPASLLFSTDSPGFVIKKANHYKYQPFILLKISFSMLILLLLIFSDEKKYSKISFSVKNKLLRRNEQVA